MSDRRKESAMKAAKVGDSDLLRTLLKDDSSLAATQYKQAKTDVVSLLHIAAANGHTNLIDMLLNHGADINATDRQGQTPLHTALGYGKREFAEALVQRGADVNARGHLARTPIFFSLWNLEVTKSLLDKGALATVQDEIGETPLHLAAELGALEIVRLLVERGATVDVTSTLGKTPMQLAEEKQHGDVAKFLQRKSRAWSPKTSE